MGTSRLKITSESVVSTCYLWTPISVGKILWFESNIYIYIYTCSYWFDHLFFGVTYPVFIGCINMFLVQSAFWWLNSMCFYQLKNLRNIRPCFLNERQKSPCLFFFAWNKNMISIFMDPSTFSGSVWSIIYYILEGWVPSQTVFGSIGYDRTDKW